MPKFKIGWSEVSITPDKKVSLAGQFYKRIPEYVETPITVTAMAIKDESDHMVICSCDITSVGSNLMKLVREGLKDVEGLNLKMLYSMQPIHTLQLNIIQKETSLHRQVWKYLMSLYLKENPIKSLWKQITT